MDERARQFLEQYLVTLSADVRGKYTNFDADYFCADEASANICADLIRQGIKVATCSLKHWYISAEEKMPETGNLQVVTNWDGEPTSIIEITAVSECRFSEVDVAFARAEGEGDLSLDWWRKAHWKFFTEECSELGIAPSEDMVLVQEWFKVVFKG
ncbi:MAG: ASCH domain-containing protein [Desulfobacteraceae bacterium]|nr:ASCH domain-containing protein [Desulfobacteraceae bacterium]